MAVILLEELDLLADVFETGQSLDQGYVVSLCDLPGHFSGHDGGDNGAVLRKDTQFFSLGKEVLQNQHTGHVSGKALVLAGFRVLCVNAETVSIRVGSEDDICIHLFGQLEGQSESFLILRVRVADSREITIRKLLLFYHMNLGKAKLF